MDQLKKGKYTLNLLKFNKTIHLEVIEGKEWGTSHKLFNEETCQILDIPSNHKYLMVLGDIRTKVEDSYLCNEIPL